MTARFKDVSLGSQARLLLALALPTAAVIFCLFVGLRLAGLPMTRSGLDPGLFVALLVALIMAGLILLLQLAALLFLRLLPWRGPRLKIETEQGDALRRVFE
ncbi:MAG TPA: hypothetical protein VF548_02975 [Allosphingosinicella sp.]|jgi:hypothetical protein